MAQCCWYPVPYAGQPYSLGEMPNVRWWEQMVGRYVPVDYFTERIDVDRAGLSSSLFSGRPDDFFPYPERNDLDHFGVLRDALARQLFREDGYPRTVTIGQRGFQTPTFDALSTYYDSSLGGSVYVLFVVVPDEWYLAAPGGSCLSIAQVASQLSESHAQLGVWEEFLYDGQDDFKISDLIDAAVDAGLTAQVHGVRALQQVFQDLYNCWQEAGRALSEAVPIPPHFFLAEFYDPTITMQGGGVSLITSVFRATGGQRLQVELEREIQPWTHDPGAPLSDRESRTFRPIYVVYTSRVSWLQAIATGDGSDSPPANYLSLLFRGAEGPGPRRLDRDNRQLGGRKIVQYHNDTWGGSLGDAIVKVNGEIIPDSELDAFHVRSKMTFQNVQDYSPPTDFVLQEGMVEIPDYQIPTFLRGEPNSADLVLDAFNLTEQEDFVFQLPPNTLGCIVTEHPMLRRPGVPPRDVSQIGLGYPLYTFEGELTARLQEFNWVAQENLVWTANSTPLRVSNPCIRFDFPSAFEHYHYAGRPTSSVSGDNRNTPGIFIFTPTDIPDGLNAAFPEFRGKWRIVSSGAGRTADALQATQRYDLAVLLEDSLYYYEAADTDHVIESTTIHAFICVRNLTLATTGNAGWSLGSFTDFSGSQGGSRGRFGSFHVTGGSNPSSYGLVPAIVSGGF